MKQLKKKLSGIHTTSLSIIRSFSVAERVIFVLLALVMTVSAVALVSQINQRISVEIPGTGGTLKEGIIGTPRFINPVLAESMVDKDMTRLIYSGLMRKNGETMTPDLAESYEISPDGLTYTFVLRDNIYFHDKTPVSVGDIIFTISSIQNSAVKSSERINWNGVRVTKIDDQTVSFTLGQPYAGFLENTTIGILPRHLWGGLSADQLNFTDLNIKAVGSGPYKIRSIKRNAAGIPEKMKLVAFKKFALGKAFIPHITIHFYANEADLITGLTKGSIDSASAIDPQQALPFAKKRRFTVHTVALPRVFGLFFNQNEAPIFLDTKVVAALNTAVNKEAIVRRVLGGYGTALEGPIPPNTLGYTKTTIAELTSEERASKAGEMLSSLGWRLNEASGLREKNGTVLAFSLATSNTPELKEVATMIQKQLAGIGVTVDIQVFETGNLEQDIIRPRKYQALLFGQELQHDTNLFDFWHSSQRNDPGLNVALYTDTQADTLLEKVRTTLDETERAELYQTFTETLDTTAPVIFLYAPDFIYVARKKIQGVTLDITTSADRFNTLHTWFIHKNTLWRIFTKK